MLVISRARRYGSMADSHCFYDMTSFSFIRHHRQPAPVLRVGASVLALLLLFQHFPLAFPANDPSCCDTEWCCCRDDTLECPMDGHHSSADSHDASGAYFAALASSGEAGPALTGNAAAHHQPETPSIRTCGTSDLMPVVTFSIQKFFLKASPHLASPGSHDASRPFLSSLLSQRATDDIFHPPKRSLV